MLDGYTKVLYSGTILITFKYAELRFENIFVEQVWQNAPKDRELEGQVVDCLKQNFVSKKPLTQTCSNHLAILMEQQALHYQLDPVLTSLCDSEVFVFLKKMEPNKTGFELCLWEFRFDFCAGRKKTKT